MFFKSFTTVHCLRNKPFAARETWLTLFGYYPKWSKCQTFPLVIIQSKNMFSKMSFLRHFSFTKSLRRLMHAWWAEQRQISMFHCCSLVNHELTADQSYFQVPFHQLHQGFSPYWETFNPAVLCNRSQVNESAIMIS